MLSDHGLYLHAFLIQSSDLPEKEESDKYQLRIQQIDNYIRTNYRSAISMKELSENCIYPMVIYPDF